MCGLGNLIITRRSRPLFVIYDMMKIWRKRLTRSVNYEAVFRTAPATPGLLIMLMMALGRYGDFLVCLWSLGRPMRGSKI